MRKLIISMLVLLALPIACLAYSAGNYETLQNLNIRSSRSITNNLIGYFAKGATVTVTAVSGDWCTVVYKRYANAYVKCSYLKAVGEPGEVQVLSGLSPANKVLDDLNHWLMDSKEYGRKYINSAWATGFTAALEWQKDAGPSGFTFEYPFTAGSKCVCFYASPSATDKVMQFICADAFGFGPSGSFISSTGNIDQKIPAEFKVPMAAVVARMIDGNGKINPLLRSYFSSSKSVKVTFTLSEENGGAFWSIKYTDEKGLALNLKVDATDTAAEFIVNPGV